MTDTRPPAPDSWHRAFAALTLESPPADAWPQLAARVRPVRRATRRPVWLALAATVALALALRTLLPLLSFDASHNTPSAPAVSVTPQEDAARLVALQHRSAQLEAWLAQVRDERVATGVAATLSQTLQARLELIDAALSEPSLPAPDVEALWRGRVDTLQRLTAFESGQRVLAAQGQRYDGQLVAVY